MSQNKPLVSYFKTNHLFYLAGECTPGLKYYSSTNKCYAIAPDIDNQAYTASSKSKGDSPCSDLDLGTTHKTTSMNQYCHWGLRAVVAVRIILLTYILSFS